MKKAIISALILSVLILGGSSAAIAVRNSGGSETGSPMLMAVETELSQSSKSLITPKNETVYAITDADGTINKTFVNNLDVITCGTYPPNPSELLASKKNKKLIDKLRGMYSIIIFDGAPVGGLADSVILSTLMDETIIVTRDGATNKNEFAATAEALKKVDAKVAGVVFNLVNRKSSKYYNHYYYYGEKPSEK